MFHWILGQILTLNYFTDQQGIMRRYLAEKDNWEPHLTHCKNYILNTLPDKKNLNIAVLGSGWLLDVPISVLLTNNQLALFDINHPRQIQNKYRMHSNVTFIKKDLTYGLLSKAQSLKTMEEFITYAEIIKTSQELLNYDWVISVNLLNQLDILLMDFIINKFKASESDINRVRKIIQDNHILSLPKGKSVLISDWIEQTVDDFGAVKEIKPLIYTDLLNSKKYQEWTWVFDTKKKYHKNNNTSFIVRAMTI